jgi:hypothetical protein
MSVRRDRPKATTPKKPMDHNRSETWANCLWRAEACCLLRERLRLLEIARDHRAAGDATPLTPRAMRQRMLETSTDDSLRCSAADGCGCPLEVVPKHDRDRCELSVNGFVILRLGRRQNQHAVLCAFEDQGWPPWIQWPIATDAENGHHDTVKLLNCGQKTVRLIKFSCDGTGEGVRWEFVHY